MLVERSSPSLKVVPPSSTWARRLSRSSPGARRRSARSSKKYCANWVQRGGPLLDHLLGQEEVGIEPAGERV